MIARRDRPLVRLSIYQDKPVRRKAGLLPELVKEMNDCFNDPLDDRSDSIIPTDTHGLSRKK